MAAGASPSIIDLQSLSARMLSAAQFTDQDKFALIRAALESRDDEQLTKQLNQRCLQLRAIGMAKETKLVTQGALGGSLPGNV